MIDHDLRNIVSAVETMENYISELEKLVLKLEGKRKGNLNSTKRWVNKYSRLYHKTCTGDSESMLYYPEAYEEEEENAES